MEAEELSGRVSETDPAVALRAVGALHRLAAQVEAAAGAHAGGGGWAWGEIWAARGSAVGGGSRWGPRSASPASPCTRSTGSEAVVLDRLIAKSPFAVVVTA